MAYSMENFSNHSCQQQDIMVGSSGTNIKQVTLDMGNWSNVSPNPINHQNPSWQDLFQPDYDKGDIHWSLSEYNFIFKKGGFSSYHHDVHTSNLFQSFVLKYNENHD